MPELIKNGPNIPAELMNRRDDGNVIFFCGAGISVDTGLPNFADLTSEIYEQTGQVCTPLEYDLFKRGQFDKVLGLLEERLNPGRLRQEIIKRLSQPPAPGSLEVHRAIITLSKTSDSSIRLVTTNFDDRFVRAGCDESIIDSAPKLPIPKPHDWRTVVHLHGRIQPNDSGYHLVLTAADFGRAYLTERWAARFITELFREFTVVFVGYSLNDPVLSYMVDALAAERARGARFQKAYAFADYKGGDAGRVKAEIAWRGKNVEPLLFHSRNKFIRLNKTLIEWARICQDPLSARRKIILQGIRRLPDGGDHASSSERVCWALADPVTAETLAHSAPISRESDYPKIAAWLQVFDGQRLLSRGMQPLSSNEPHNVPIVSTQFALDENSRLDGVSARIAYWLAQHAHVPQVLGWLVQKGGRLHLHFRSLLLRRLAARSSTGISVPDIPDRLRLLWTVILHTEPYDPEVRLWSKDLIRNAKTEAERSMVERTVVDSLRPRLEVRPGPSSRLRYRRFDAHSGALTPLEECGHLVLTLGDSDTRPRRTKPADHSGLMAKYAFQLTDHLNAAMHLLVQDEEGIAHPEFYRPAIEDHEQNRLRADWTALIDWVRDSYFALVELKDGQASLLIRRWQQLDHEIFTRLTLHV